MLCSYVLNFKFLISRASQMSQRFQSIRGDTPRTDSARSHNTPTPRSPKNPEAANDQVTIIN